MFLVSAGSSTISIYKVGNIYSFFFRNEKGEPVDTVAVGLDKPEFEMAASLYKLVIEQVFGKDKTINSLIEWLEGDTENPSKG